MPFDDGINKAVFLQRFSALKIIGNLLVHRLLNYPLAGKTDQSMWLSQNNIALHRIACRHSARCRIRQHADIQQAAIAVFLTAWETFAICIKEKFLLASWHRQRP